MLFFFFFCSCSVAFHLCREKRRNEKGEKKMKDRGIKTTMAPRDVWVSPPSFLPHLFSVSQVPLGPLATAHRDYDRIVVMKS